MKTLERTLTIVKPDAVKRNAIGDIIEQFEKKGFRILSMKMLEITKHQAEQFYAVHASRPFFTFPPESDWKLQSTGRSISVFSTPRSRSITR